MAQKLPTYLRTYRKRFGLTQKEIAFLLGANYSVTISKYETCSRKPTLYTALALQLMFDVPMSELFPAIHTEVEQLLISRARLLSRQLENMNPNETAHKKITFINSIASGKGGGQQNYYE